MQILGKSQVDDLIQKLKDIARHNPNGFTVYLDGLLPVTSGWSVALNETQNCHSDEGLKHVIAIANAKTGIVGGWREDGENKRPHDPGLQSVSHYAADRYAQYWVRFFKLELHKISSSDDGMYSGL